ncbi:STAS domain-containing protein [Lentzea sp. NPDC059081]|uniref:STAS domain-containing protein n=1 Tax=Lentzea sp. NPDC059081 TaxID=3346719 RepID=UPI0036908C0B
MPNIFPMHVQREVNGLAVVVRATGEIDQTTVTALSAELRTAVAMATPPFPVVVDLTGVTFFGSAGLNELLRHERDAATAGVPFRIAASHRVVLRPISMSGLDGVLHVHPDVRSALAPERTVGRAG